MSNPNIPPKGSDPPYYEPPPAFPIGDDIGLARALHGNAAALPSTNQKPDYESIATGYDETKLLAIKSSSAAAAIVPHSPNTTTRQHKIPPPPDLIRLKNMILTYGKLVDWPSHLISQAINDICVLGHNETWNEARVDISYDILAAKQPTAITRDYLLSQYDFKWLLYELRIRNYDAKDINLDSHELNYQWEIARSCLEGRQHFFDTFDELNWSAGIDMALTYGVLSRWDWVTIANILTVVSKNERAFTAASLAKYWRDDMILERQTERWLAVQPSIHNVMLHFKLAGFGGVTPQEREVVVNMDAETLWKLLEKPPKEDELMTEIEAVVILYGRSSGWEWDYIFHALGTLYKPRYRRKWTVEEIEYHLTQHLSRENLADLLLDKSVTRGINVLLKLKGFHGRHIFDHMDDAKIEKRREELQHSMPFTNRDHIRDEKIQRLWAKVDWHLKNNYGLFSPPGEGKAFSPVEDILIGCGRRYYSWEWKEIWIAIYDIYGCAIPPWRSLYELEERYNDYIQYIPLQYYRETPLFETIWYILVDLGYSIRGEGEGSHTPPPNNRKSEDSHTPPPPPPPGNHKEQQISKWTNTQENVVYSPPASIYTVASTLPRTSSANFMENPICIWEGGQLVPPGQKRVEYVRPLSPGTIAAFPPQMRERYPKRVSCRNSPEPTKKLDGIEIEQQESTNKSGVAKMEQSEEQHGAAANQPFSDNLDLDSSGYLIDDDWPSMSAFSMKAFGVDGANEGMNSSSSSLTVQPTSLKKTDLWDHSHLPFGRDLNLLVGLSIQTKPAPYVYTDSTFQQPYQDYPDQLDTGPCIGDAAIDSTGKKYWQAEDPIEVYDTTVYGKQQQQQSSAQILHKAIDELHNDNEFWRTTFANIENQPQALDLSQILPESSKNHHHHKTTWKDTGLLSSSNIITLPSTPAALQPIPSYLIRLSVDKYVDVNEIKKWFLSHPHHQQHSTSSTSSSSYTTDKQENMTTAVVYYPYPLLPTIPYQPIHFNKFLEVEEIAITIGLRDYGWSITHVIAGIRYLWDPNYLWDVVPRTEGEVERWWGGRHVTLRERCYRVGSQGYEKIRRVLERGMDVKLEMGRVKEEGKKGGYMTVEDKGKQRADGKGGLTQGEVV